MSKVSKEFYNQITGKNTKIFIKIASSLIVATDFLKITADESNISSFLTAEKHDKLIVLEIDNKCYLYKIDSINENNDEFVLRLMLNIEVNEIYSAKHAKDINLCDFNIYLPIVILKDTFIFPYENTNLLIGRHFSVSAVHKALELNCSVIITKQLDSNSDEVSISDIYNVGTVSDIKKIQKIDIKTYKTNFLGKYRVNINEVILKDDVYMGKCTIFDEKYDNLSFNTCQKTYFVKLNALRQKTGSLEIPTELIDALIDSEDPLYFTFTIVSFMIFNAQKRSDIIKSELSEILEMAILDLQERIYYIDFEEKIDSTVKKSISNKNKQFWIKEKIEALKKEISESDSYQDEFVGKTKEDPNLYPEHVKQVIKEEMDKYKKNPHMSDGYVIQQHLKWIYSLPWYTVKKGKTDLNEIYEYINKYHVGSENVKTALLETINVRNPEESGNIILLVGPPGVGKTSIGQIFAQALDLPFFEISLNGMFDPAFLLGHSRTYIASLPGMIVYALKHMGVLNGVIILDEFDKINQNSGKDTMSTVLRMLDVNQNDSFKDNYLEPTMNLQKITFILTANSLSGVHPAILDRCKIINLNGYSVYEKLEISKKIIEKLQVKLFIEKDEIEFSDEVLMYIIQNYTRESGTRKLAQILETLLKKIVIDINRLFNKKSETKETFKININQVDEYLKKSDYRKNTPSKIHPGVGTVMGLAYTMGGGESLFIQCVAVPKDKGKEDIKMTGNIAKVMQESLDVAVGYIKSNAATLDIDPDFFNKFEVRVHVPEGAIPKDGPSAGVTICTALVSLIKNKPVKLNVAMTGEIALNGVVLPVGGLIEKLYAANREAIINNITTGKKKKNDELFNVFVPSGNMDYIQNNLDPRVIKNLNIIAVEHVSEILSRVFN